MTSIDPRVAGLERRLRWLTAVCVFLGLGLLILIIRPFFDAPRGATDRSRPDRPDLMLRSLSIPDSTGVVRLQAGLYRDGTPFLRLNGPDGRERLAGAVGADGQPEIRLADREGRGSARIELDDHGRALIRLSGANGDPVMALLGRGDGRPALVMWDAATRETLFAAPDRRPRQAAASR
jgi:hypothetical protein